jgi:hypothetical protein
MTVPILATQIVLPLALLGWLAFAPATSLAGLIAQAAGTGALLFAPARVAQGAVPVRRLPSLSGALRLVAVASHPLRREPGTLPWLPAGARGWAARWAALALSFVLLAVGG